MDTMNDDQRETLKTFKERIKDVQNKRHDDHALYKWLKARSFNLKKSEEMYRKSMAWRNEVGADTILRTFKVPEVMEKYYPGGLCGQDKEGRPLWIDPLGGGDLRGIMYSVKKSDLMKTLVFRLEALYEEFRSRTKKNGRQIDQCVHIIDMQGFGSNFMWKPALDLYIEVLHMLEDNYPETLKKTYFVNAPRIFKVGYNVIKKFIDKETANKFTFLDGNWKQSIAEVIELDGLPEHYGGNAKDPDGDPKCSSKICYGGEVPKTLYRKKEDFFPSTPKPETLGRSGSLILAYDIPDVNHVIRFIFTIDGTDVEFGAFLDTSGTKKPLSRPGEKQKGVDTSSMETVLAFHKYECHRVPEDGILMFETPGTCYLHFRNTSRVFKRVLSYLIEVDTLDDDHTITDVTKKVIPTTIIVEEDTNL